MASSIQIGNLFLINSSGAPTQGGDPTVISTTPFSVLNEGWTPQVAPPISIWGGGPPFVPGRKLAYQSYDDVTEKVPITLRASSTDNVAALLQQLRQELGKANALFPVVLAIKPNGATNTMYSEIKAAYVQENSRLLNPSAGFVDIFADIIWIRAPFFGQLSTGETVINAQTINNTFGGSPSNVVAYTAGSGDMIYDGQPLNLALTNASGSTMTNFLFYLGTIDSITTDATTQTVTTSSTTGASPGSGDVITVGTVLDAKQATKIRLIGKTSTVTNSPEMRLKVYFSANAPTPFYIGPWVAPQANGSYYDAGTVPSYLFKDTGITTLYVLLEVRSPGGSVTVTLSNFYVVYYYSLCKVSGLDSIPNSTGIVNLRSFVATSNRPCLPLRKAEAYVLNSGSQTYYGRVDGTPPVYISGASLWHLALDKTTFASVNSVFTATVTHAPLWRTLRGAD